MKRFLAACGLFALTTGALYVAQPSQNTKALNAIPAVVLGGGIGGLTAALYLANAGHQTHVVEGELPGGLLTQSASVRNWPGELEITGDDLALKLKAQCISHGVTFSSSQVTDADFSSYPYTITTQSLVDPSKSEQLSTLGVVIAMGTNSNYLGVPGEQEYWGKGVSNCAVCDGGLYKDKTVCVVGGGDAAIEEAAYLSRLCKKVYVLVRKGHLRAIDKRKDFVLAKPNVEILYNHEVAQVLGDAEGVTGIALQNNRTRTSSTIACDGLFLAIGSTPNGNLFSGKLTLDDKGYIVVDAHQETSKRGVYAIGDIADPRYKQAITAAGDGCKAALELNEFLETIDYTSAPTTGQNAAKQHTVATRGAIDITSSTDFDTELSNDGLVVVDFYATWCSPCKRMLPVFKEVAREYEGKATFLKVDIDKNKALANRFGIKSVPTFLFYKKGKVVGTMRGFNPKTTLTAQIDKLIK